MGGAAPMQHHAASPPCLWQPASYRPPPRPPAHTIPPTPIMPPHTWPAGLPNAVAKTKQALARGYAVVAVSSRDRSKSGRCFSMETDGPAVAEVVATVGGWVGGWVGGCAC